MNPKGRSPRTSILIAVKADNPYLRECLQHCGRLLDQDFEIVVLPDHPCRLPYPKTRVHPTGAVGPSHKRDQGVAVARGRYLAFLDDDTYPEPGWLTAAVTVLRAPNVAAVGGPAVTPPDDADRARASGLVYAAWLVGGPYRYRYAPQAARDVDDYPTCNLIFKRTALDAAGGFDTCYWPGEDTVICLKVVHELKLRIVYDPRVLVYHHRRPLWRGHLKQVVSYATHRGYFVKKFPKTSLRPSYFVPSALLLGLAAGWLPALYWPGWWPLWLGGVGVYAALLLLTGLTTRPRRLIAWVMGGVLVTHLAYGLYFVRGLLAGRLQEETAAALVTARKA